MAHLVRPWQVRYVNDAGRRVPKSTPGAKKVRERAAKWYGQGLPNTPPAKRVPLATDRAAAQRMLDEMVRKLEKGHAGLPDRDASRRPLSEFLAELQSDLTLGLGGKGGKRRRVPSEDQVKLVMRRLRNLTDGCGFACPADLNAAAPARLAKYLQARVGKSRKEDGLSPQTADFYLAAARRLARWLSRRSPVLADLFDGLPGFDPNNDRRHARREISPVELGRLLDTTLNSTRIARRLTGRDRYFLYLVAFSTGYRAGELSKLQPESFDLDAEPPMVTLPARYAKNKKAARQPLPPGVADLLRDYLQSKPAGESVWPGTWSVKPVKLLRRDLAEADVPYVVETPDGFRYADFHALRHSYVSALAASGVSGKELQELARHGDLRLTLGTYTHTRAGALGDAVARLAVPGLVAVSPFATMSRRELEGALAGMLAAFASLLSPPAPVARPVARTRATSGDSRGPSETGRGSKASA